MKYLKRFNEEFLPELLTLGMAFWMCLKLLRWLLGLTLNKLTRQIVSDVLKSAEFQAKSLSGKRDTKTNKMSWEEGLKVAEFGDRYYVTMTGMFAKIPNFRVLKDEKKLILNAEKEQSQILDLTDEEYDEFLKIIKSKTEPIYKYNKKE